MASLGSLVIELAANTARMQSDLGKAVNIAQSAATRMTNAFRTVSSVLGAGGLSLTASAVFAKFIQNSSEAQASMLKLEGAVRRAGTASGVTVGQISALANGIQSASRFSDEAIKDAATNLLRFDKVTGETFTRALKISADLAEVMGTDVSEAASQLGKALQLPGEGLRVLTNAGIKFNDEQIKTLQYMTENGQAMEAQNIILDELAKRTSGAASQGVKTLGGAFAQLSNQIGELVEAPGIIDSITAATNKLAAALERMRGSSLGQSISSGISAARRTMFPFLSLGLDATGAMLGPDAPKSPGHRRFAGGDGAGDPLAAATASRLAVDAAKKSAKELEKIQKDINESIQRLTQETADAVSDSLHDTWKEQEEDAQKQREFYANMLEQWEATEAEAAANVSYFMDEATKRAKWAAETMQDYFAEFLFDPFHDGLKGMLKGFIDTIRRMVAEAAAAKIFGGKSSGGFGLGDLITGGLGKGLSSLFGFAGGGSFKVGGSGGVDSQLVAFKASPNETVSVTRPGQGGGGITIAPVYQIDARGATMELAEALPGILRQNNAILLSDIINGIRRGKYAV